MRPNLRQMAAQQAQAEYNPQIRGVRRETRGQVKSLRSMQPALEASLLRSRRQIGNAGLTAKDRAIALVELANRTADVGASTALQIGQTREAGHGQIVDLLQSEGAAQRSALSSLQAAAAEHAQSLHDEQAAEARGFSLDLQKELAEKKLGLGTYAPGGSAGGGLTPTQERESSQSKHNAAFYAKALFQATKNGVKLGPSGKPLSPEDPSYAATPWAAPPDPRKWDDSIWQGFTGKVHSQKGVNSVTDAEHAVQAIREHVDPGSGTPKTPEQMLAYAAGQAGGHAAGDLPAAIVQAAGSLLHRR